jgi:hypothetical protein
MKSRSPIIQSFIKRFYKLNCCSWQKPLAIVIGLAATLWFLIRVIPKPSRAAYPFNNAVEPYENTSWPASVLASMDGVALDCVGLDILNSQTKNNIDSNGHSRILLRNNADDYLQVHSLGVHEHWDRR